MTEGHRKPIRKSRRIKLTEIAAIIAAIGGLGGLITAFHGLFISSTTTTTTSNVPNTVVTTTSSHSNQHVICGTQLSETDLFGSWSWVGTYNGATQSGIFTFKNDCIYTNVPKSGFTLSDEGSFVIDKSPTTTIKLQSKSGNIHAYLINNIQNNSFHLYDLDNKVNLDFARQS